MNNQAVIAYFERLAMQHNAVGHSDVECHFSALVDEAQNKFAERMHYPCVSIDTGDIDWQGTVGAVNTHHNITLFFLDHVADTGDYERIQDVMDETGTIMEDFMKRMNRDRSRGVDVMKRFNPDGTEAQRVVLDSAGLYGWMLIFDFTQSFNYLDCGNAWNDEM